MRPSDEAVETIANNIVAATARRKAAFFDGVYTHDSKRTPSIQLTDFLVGAVASAWERDAVAAPKLNAQMDLAWHLSWPDLRADTAPSERKFNVWVFYDPTKDRRRPPTRSVRVRSRGEV